MRQDNRQKRNAQAVRENGAVKRLAYQAFALCNFSCNLSRRLPRVNQMNAGPCCYLFPCKMAHCFMMRDEANFPMLVDATLTQPGPENGRIGKRKILMKA